MLRFMRKYATGYLVKALFGLIIVVFIFWGVGSFKERDKVVAEVGPYKVSIMEYHESYKKLLNLYRMILKDKMDDAALKELNIREKAMDQVVDRYLLLGAAKDLGFTMSDAEFDTYLASVDAFKVDGKFSPRLYAEMLKRNGLDAKQFEAQEKVTLLTSRAGAVMRDNAVALGEDELWSAYVQERGMVNLGYLEIDPADYRKNVTVDEKEVEGIYEKEKGQYRTERRYRLAYLVVDQKSGMKDDAVYMELLKAKDLSAYGRQKGFQVTDLGLLGEKDVKEKLKGLKVEEWLKDLKKGDVSLPVRTDRGAYIFQLLEFEEGRAIDKTIVVGEIRERLLNEKARGFARAQAEDMIAKRSAVFKKETGFIPRNATSIPGVGAVAREDAGILSLNENKPYYGKPVTVGNKIFVFGFKAEKQPDKAQWEKEKASYRRYLAGKRQDEVFRSMLEEMKKKTKVTIHWSEV